MELLNVPTIGSGVGAAKVLLLDGVTVKESACTSAGRALIAGADNTAQRQTLGLGDLAILNSISLSTSYATGILPISKGGTGTSSGLPYGSVKDLTYPSILGRKTNSTGNAELLSASDVLNMVGTTHGSILYRGASGWLELQPGSPGQVLSTQGPNANPAWTTVSGGGTGGRSASFSFSDPAVPLTLGLQIDPPSDGFPFPGYLQTQKRFTMHRAPFIPTAFQLSLNMVETLEGTGSNPNPIPDPAGIRLQYSTNGTTWLDAATWDLRGILGFSHITGVFPAITGSAVFFRISSYNLNSSIPGVVQIQFNSMNIALSVWR